MNESAADDRFYRPANAPIKPTTADDSRCPDCGRPTTAAPVRRCAACGRGMSNHDKYYFREDGRIQHKNCKDPTAYQSTGFRPDMLEGVA